MKTMTIKIDNTLVQKIMQRGGFSEPDEAVSYWLKKVIETPGKIQEQAKKPHHPKVVKMTGILKNFENYEDLRRNALEEKYLK